jgi:hypothetical protein
MKESNDNASKTAITLSVVHSLRVLDEPIAKFLIPTGCVTQKRRGTPTNNETGAQSMLLGLANGLDHVVPETGIEPVRPLFTKRRILSPMCLPISPLGHGVYCETKKPPQDPIRRRLMTQIH